MGEGKQRDLPAGFFKLTSLPDARRLCAEAFDGLRTAPVSIQTVESLDRVLEESITNGTPLPHFARSVVDGYALRSADTAGATAGLPAYLEIVGSVEMGQPTTLEVKSGHCVEVPTGGMLPTGADAAIMIEHTERLGPTTVEIGRSIPVGANMIGIGDDLERGTECLTAGRRLAPGDLALLATLGVMNVSVYRRPRVAILSTGDEVVPPSVEPGPAEVRDANASGLAAMVRRCGGEAQVYGIVKDVSGDLAAAAGSALEDSDVLLISGGSSVGERDHAKSVIESLGEPGVLLHGLAIKPGKPTIAARVGDKLAFGLPGHPLSAMVSFHTLIRPILRRLGGENDVWEPQARARLTRKVPSDAGRTEFVRVDLHPDEAGGLVAEPLFGKSAALSSLIAAKGLVEVPIGVEGYDEGAEVSVQLF